MNFQSRFVNNLLSTVNFRICKSSAFFSMSGKDTVRYLHGRTTQDIKGLKVGEGRETLILNPQGKIQGKCTIINLDSHYGIQSDCFSNDAEKAAFVSALLQFKIADQVELLDLSNLASLIFFGKDISMDVEKLFGVSFLKAPISGYETKIGTDEIFIIRRINKGFCFFDLVAPFNLCEKVIKDLSDILGNSLRESYEEESEQLRIFLGIPRYAVDISERNIAPEIENINSLVSFTKGCYSGQEVVEKAVALGRVGRKLLHFFAEGVHSFSPGTEILGNSDETPDNFEPCGTITSSCTIPEDNRTYCLATLKAKYSDAELFKSIGDIKLNRIVSDPSL